MNSKQVNETVNKLFSFMQDVKNGDLRTILENMHVGIVSGNDVPDKLEKARFHTVKSDFVDAPVIAELPMTLECRLISFDEKTGCTVGEIVNVSADESACDKDCRAFLEKYEYGNLIGQIEDNFKKCRFFAISAIGHSQADHFSPEGLEEAIEWVLKSTED